MAIGLRSIHIAADDVPAVSHYVHAQKEHHQSRALEPTFELIEDFGAS